MEEIKQSLYQRILTDDTLQDLTGYSEQDPRVYSSHPPQHIVVNSSKPSYITLALASLGKCAGPDGEANPDEIYNVEIWGASSGDIESVFSRVSALLEGWTFDTTNYRGMWVRLLDAVDSFDAVASVYRRRSRWQVYHVLKVA